jgi:TolB-like protein/Tfp pilus assembly protein PilF
MAEERVQRRLAAILAADIVGYSRLMEQDEAGTLALLKNRRQEVLDPLLAEHQGRLVKLMGDGVLVEFASAVNAVECASALQQDMAKANASLDDTQHIVWRIGINLGDVMVEGADLYGEGVNIAVRLEGIAEPGGVLISGSAFDQVKNKIKIAFDDLGFHTLKNINEPVRIYRAAGTPPRSPTETKATSNKASIAVLPFTNMSGDPEQQYFVDGIAEDIITELARFRQLHVLSRNSSFQFIGKNVDVIRVGRELRVEYLLEGSVRRMGNRIRVTAQLIDAASGNHLWAERFDRSQDEIFAVQDQVVGRIVGTLAGRVHAYGVEKAKRKPPASLSAYECVLRADALPFNDTEAEAQARLLYEKAIELDPNYARAHALLAFNILHEWQVDMSGSNDLLDQAAFLARKAIALDENDSLCHEAMAWIQLSRGSFDLAEHHYERASELTPNRAVTIAGRGELYVCLGKPEEGLTYLKEAKVLDPFFNPSWYWPSVGLGYFACSQYGDAIVALNRSSTMPYSTICISCGVLFAD